MEDNKYTNKNGRIRLEPKLRSGTRHKEDLLKDEDLEVRLFNEEKFIKKNAIRLILCVLFFALIYAVKSLPFSTAQKITQGVKWAMTYEMNLEEGLPDSDVITTISNHIEGWTGIGEDTEKEENNVTKYISPVEGTVTLPFKDEVHPIFKTKIEARGIEISTKSAGDIQAIATGKIVNIQESVENGKRITIKHENSMKSVYEGCYKSSLKINDQVQQGDILGKTKTVEEGESSVLYFELWKGDYPVNPSDYMELKVDTAN